MPQLEVSPRLTPVRSVAKLSGYVLALQPRDDGEPRLGPEALRNVRHIVVDIVKKQIPDLDWQLVDRLENLPAITPALMPGEVMRGSWRMEGDDSQMRQVRWYRGKRSTSSLPPPRRSWMNGMQSAHATFAQP
jgi:hypothetical protein